MTSTLLMSEDLMLSNSLMSCIFLPLIYIIGVLGCGLSVRFDLAQTPQVMQVYRRLNPGALIGFYRVEGYGTRHLSLTPLLEKR